MFTRLHSLRLSLLLSAAALVCTTPATAKRTPSAAEQSTAALSRLKEAAAGSQASAITQARTELLAKQAQLDAELAAIEARIKSGKLPAALLARHSAALAELQARRSELAGKIAAADVAAYLRSLQKTTTQAALDPAKLPKPGGAVRAPLLKVEDYPQNAGSAKSAAEVTPQPKARIVPTAAELGETPETTFTPDIRMRSVGWLSVHAGKLERA